MLRPLAIDLFCGLGGWAEGLLAEGYRVIGFDIERHEYGEHRYPAQLVIQDVLTLHGSQFRDAALIVASPPCQAYSYRAMPWSRAKALPPPDNTPVRGVLPHSTRGVEAATRRIPADRRKCARGASHGSGALAGIGVRIFYWGDTPALFPDYRPGAARKGSGASWFYQNGGNGRSASSQSPERRELDSQVSKIPLPLSRHIAATFRP